MQDKIVLIMLGWALSSTLTSFFLGWMLYKKNTTENKIANLKQKNKRNRKSNLDNDISANIPQTKEHKRRRFNINLKRRKKNV